MVATLLKNSADEHFRYVFKRNMEQLMKNPYNSRFYDKTQCDRYSDNGNDIEFKNHCHSNQHCINIMIDDEDITHDIICGYIILKKDVPAYFFSNCIFNEKQVRETVQSILNFNNESVMHCMQSFFCEVTTLQMLCRQICSTHDIDVSKAPLKIQKCITDLNFKIVKVIGSK